MNLPAADPPRPGEDSAVPTTPLTPGPPPSPHSPPSFSSPPDKPTRVRVTSTRLTGHTAATTHLAAEIDSQTELGDVYVDGLMRAQLRLSLLVVLIAVVAIAGFPVLLLLVPSVGTLTVWRIPLPWFMLGALVYPVVWGLARFYDRQAARLEAEFSAAVERA